MIVYSTSVGEPLRAEPGQQVVYGTSETDPRGYGTVTIHPQGYYVVNNRPLQWLLRNYNWVRLAGK